MNKPKHTPGPWEIWGETSLHIIGKAMVKGRRVCALQPVTQDEDRANARLIAAAPEMLEALEKLLNSILDPVENTRLSVSELVKIKELVTKAKGEY